MGRLSAAIRVLVVAAALLAAGAAPGRAGEGGVPLARPPLPASGQCLEPSETMRRDHMTYLLHQRDETVRGGIRGAKYSLRACIACHAQPMAASADPAKRSVLPFCAACHDYAAVTVDCFSCHTPTTTEPVRAALGSTP
jgi:hypothetical protein